MENVRKGLNFTPFVASPYDNQGVMKGQKEIALVGRIVLFHCH